MNPDDFFQNPAANTAATQPGNPPIPTTGVIAEGIPTKVSENWPHEVWTIGDHQFVVEAGTPQHFSMINARKAAQKVSVSIQFHFPSTTRSAAKVVKTRGPVADEGGEA
jgi:hypothetical protein